MQLGYAGFMRFHSPSILLSLALAACGGGELPPTASPAGVGPVVVAPPPPPTPVAPLALDFTLTPALAALGQPLTLEWSAADALSCSAQDGWQGARAISGREVLTPPTAGHYTYTLRCEAGTRSVQLSRSAVVVAAPTLMLSSERSEGDVPYTTRLRWVSTDADTCSASGGWSGAQDLSGQAEVTVTAIGTTAFTLNCSGLSGSASATLNLSGLDPYAEAQRLFQRRRAVLQP